MRQRVDLVRDNCRWEAGGQPYFDGEVEPCINGTTVALGAYFDQAVDGVVSRPIREQQDDGGWNCWAESGAAVSSAATTINVLDCLLAHERATGGSARSAGGRRRRGGEYLPERGCSDAGAPARSSTRPGARSPSRRAGTITCSVPWSTSVRQGIRRTRATEAVELLRTKGQPEGTWLLENTHPGKVHFVLEEGDGRPGRWNLLRALRVLDWYEDGSTV